MFGKRTRFKIVSQVVGLFESGGPDREERTTLSLCGNIKRIRLLAGIALLLGFGCPYPLCAGKIDEKRWSVVFEGVTVSEALNILSQKTGVKIQATRTLDTRVWKRYQEKTIDQMVRDLLRGTSHSLVWSYGPEKGASLEVRIFEKGRTVTSPGRPVTPPGRTLIQEPPPKRSLPGRKSPPPPPEEPPARREHDSAGVAEGRSEPTDSEEDAQPHRPEPPKSDEAPIPEPEKSD